MKVSSKRQWIESALLSAFCFVSFTAQAAFQSERADLSAASQYCEGKGAQLFSVYKNSHHEGEETLCAFGRAQIRDWTLYRYKRFHSEQDAVSALLHPDSAAATPRSVTNPASSHCVKVGGTVQLMGDAEGNQIGICRFSDGSEIEEWTLFRGAKSELNRQLMAVVSGPER